MAEKNLPFISVIVPFYNIEECVTYCLDSLVAQDYEGEYEILCVDDGSTDGTPAALDTYAAEHPRVKVLHKPNGGLSDARNFGVAHAAGDYITFVDGDDLVVGWYLSSLAYALVESGCGQVVGRSFPVNDPFSLHSDSLFSSDFDAAELAAYELRDEERHIEKTLYGDPIISAWAHLAPKDLYLRCPFPAGSVYEDTLSFGKHVIGQGPFAVLKRPCYGYVVRDGSITKRNSVRFEQVLQFRRAIHSLQDCVRDRSEAVNSALTYRCALEYSRLLNMISLLTDGDASEVHVVRKEARRYVSTNLAALLLDKQVIVGDKLRFLFTVYASGLYRVALNFYKGVRRG